MRRVVALVPVVALALGGCSVLLPEVQISEPPPPPEPPAEVLTGEPIDPVWELEGRMIGQPTVIDGVVVAAVSAREDELDVVGIDAKHGDELWRFPYSPGKYGNERLRPLVTMMRGDEKQYVVFQEPPEGLDAGSGFRFPLKAVDPVSGEVVAETGPTALSGLLRACPDGYNACVPIEWEPSEENKVRVPSRFLKFDIDQNEVTESGSSGGVPPGGQILAGGGLFWMPNSPKPADGATIGRMETSDPMWESSTEEVLGEGFLPQFGSTFRWDGNEEQGYFYGGYAQGTPADLEGYEQGKTLEYDLAENQEVGIDAETGDVLWTEQGVSSTCAIGSRPLAAEPLDAAVPWLPPTPVRCRATGTETRSKNGTTYDVTQLSLEGFDPQSGGAQWTQDLDPADGERLWSASGRLGADEHDVLMRDARVVRTAQQEWRLVTFHDGEDHKIPKKFAFLCKGRGADLTYEYATPFANGSTSGRIAPFPYLCTADGEPTTTQLTKGAIEGGAIDVGSGRYVYATGDGLFGYDFS